MERDEEALLRRLADIHRRVQWMADQEALSAIVKGWAARGGFLEAKNRLLDETESILDKLESED